MFSVVVKAETVTPLWTGNAWMKTTEIKAQSLLGALRFWFEIYCYAAGKPVKRYNGESLQGKEFCQKLNRILEHERNLPIIKAKRKALDEMGISLPSQIFGCNGWKGLVNIGKIKFAQKDIGNYLNLPEVICKEKRSSQSQWLSDLSKIRDRHSYHFWYFGIDYFYGELEIEFQLSDENLKDQILYPLLYFIEEYGFIGGKNNLGYGRIKFKIDDIDLSEFNKFYFHDKNVEEIIKEVRQFSDLMNESLVGEKRIGLYVQNETKDNVGFLDIIQELIRVKSDNRSKYRTKPKKRHYIFGSIKRDKYHGIKGPNATKIIPWIKKIEDNRYRYGFISLVLLKDFPKELVE